MLKVGSLAPNFRLIGTTGNAVTLKGLRGRKVVLYFYPRDDTPGCTREACDFRDNLSRLRAAGVEVYGISKDSLSTHERFRTKYGLPFELLSDPDNSVARAYGAFGEKRLYGKQVEGTIRSTFLIDETGRVQALWSPVKVDGHVAQVLERLGETAARPAIEKSATRQPAARKPASGRPARKKSAPKKSAARKSAPKKAARKKAARRPARKA